ncbi:MAG: DUF423 domain-containing protein [Balneolaceae bacterium]
MQTPRLFQSIAAFLLALGVGFGAFGAHVVQDTLSPDRFQVYQTAVLYHLIHALGLLIVGIRLKETEPSAWLVWSGWLLLSGILLFSGSLYLLILTDTASLGMVAPIGGTAFIAGWLAFAMDTLPDSRTQ